MWCLNLIFCHRVRGLGRTYHHPIPSEALSRVRLLMVCQDASFVVESAPVAPVEDEDSEELMRAAAQLDDFREQVEREELEGDDSGWAVPVTDPVANVQTGEEEAPPVLPDIHGDFLEDFSEDVDGDVRDDDMVATEPILSPEYDGTGLQDEDAVREQAEMDGESQDGELPDPEEVSIPDEQQDMEPEPQPEINPSAEGFYYWCGWLAAKFRLKYRDLGLGMPTAELEAHGSQSPFGQIPAWLGTISRGGLTVPSESFKELLLNFEDIFHSLHGNEISYEKGVVRTLRKKISEVYPEVPEDLVRSYARSRLFLRMRFLNFQWKEEKAAAAKRKAAEKAAEKASGSGKKKQAAKRPTSPKAARRDTRKRKEYL